MGADDHLADLATSYALGALEPADLALAEDILSNSAIEPAHDDVSNA